jgi:hypothetical protein
VPYASRQGLREVQYNMRPVPYDPYLYYPYPYYYPYPVYSPPVVVEEPPVVYQPPAVQRE